MSINKLKELLEKSPTETVTKDEIITLLSNIIINQEKRIEELELSVYSLEKKNGNA